VLLWPLKKSEPTWCEALTHSKVRKSSYSHNSFFGTLLTEVEFVAVNNARSIVAAAAESAIRSTIVPRATPSIFAASRCEARFLPLEALEQRRQSPDCCRMTEGERRIPAALPLCTLSHDNPAAQTL
jgi:hypothetical protein